MKKNYFMSVCLMLLMALQATAQSFTIDQLFGKWQFTADVEYTDAATQAHKETLSGNCEAVISADENYIAKIVGFAGSSVQQNINAIGAKGGQDMVKVLNLNNPQLWSDLLLANENGDNPYGVYADGEWKVQSYGPVYYNVYATEGLITIPDFTVVKVTDYQAEKATIIAKYTNVKMTLVEAEVVEVADISGEYQFKAGAGTYDTMAGSVIPTEFAVTLAKKSDDNRAYDATIAIEGYNAVTLPAAYNGVSVVLDYDNTYLDEANGIRFAPMYGDATAGKIEFMSQSETAFSLYGGFAFASDATVKAADGVTDSLVVNGNYHQWYTAGSLKMAVEAPAFNWAGVYNVKTAAPYVADGAGIDWPTEFQFEVTYYESGDVYCVTKVFGYDIININYGGLLFEPAEEGKSVEISTGNLASLGGGMFMKILDMNLSSNPIVMTVNEDGTMSITGLTIATGEYGSDNNTMNVWYSDLAITKEAAEDEEETPAFDWAGEFALTSNVVSYDGNTYPASFDVTVEFYEATDYSDAMYCVTNFMGNDVYGINYGGIVLTVAEDGKSATLANGNVLSLGGGSFLKIFDAEAKANPLTITLNEDGTLSMEDFTVVSGAWGDDENNTLVAEYTNVVLTKGDAAGIENVVIENSAVNGIFDIQGRKVSEITAPGLYIVNGKKVLVK